MTTFFTAWLEEPRIQKEFKDKLITEVVNDSPSLFYKTGLAESDKILIASIDNRFSVTLIPLKNQEPKFYQAALNKYLLNTCTKYTLKESKINERRSPESEEAESEEKFWAKVNRREEKARDLSAQAKVNKKGLNINPKIKIPPAGYKVKSHPSLNRELTMDEVMEKFKELNIGDVVPQGRIVWLGTGSQMGCVAYVKQPNGKQVILHDTEIWKNNESKVNEKYESEDRPDDGDEVMLRPEAYAEDKHKKIGKLLGLTKNSRTMGGNSRGDYGKVKWDDGTTTEEAYYYLIKPKYYKQALKDKLELEKD